LSERGVQSVHWNCSTTGKLHVLILTERRDWKVFAKSFCEIVLSSFEQVSLFITYRDETFQSIVAVVLISLKVCPLRGEMRETIEKFHFVLLALIYFRKYIQRTQIYPSSSWHQFSCLSRCIKISHKESLCTSNLNNSIIFRYIKIQEESILIPISCFRRICQNASEGRLRAAILRIVRTHGINIPTETTAHDDVCFSFQAQAFNPFADILALFKIRILFVWTRQARRSVACTFEICYPPARSFCHYHFPVCIIVVVVDTTRRCRGNERATKKIAKVQLVRMALRANSWEEW